MFNKHCIITWDIYKTSFLVNSAIIQIQNESEFNEYCRALFVKLNIPTI